MLFLTEVWPVPFLCAYTLSLAHICVYSTSQGYVKAVWNWVKACLGMSGCHGLSLRSQQQVPNFTHLCFTNQILFQEPEVSQAISGTDHQCMRRAHPSPWAPMSTAPGTRWGKVPPQVVDWVFNCLIMRLQSNVLLLFSCWRVVL